jgi:hypothetical protein
MTSLNSKVGALARKALLNESSILANNHHIASASEFIISDEDRACSEAIHDLLFYPPDCFSFEEAQMLAHWISVA